MRGLGQAPKDPHHNSARQRDSCDKRHKRDDECLGRGTDSGGNLERCPTFKEDDDQRNCCKCDADLSEIIKCYEAKNRACKNSKDGKQQDVRDFCPLEESRKHMGHEDQDADYEDQDCHR